MAFREPKLQASLWREARIVRVIGDYDVVTVMIEYRTGKVERMYACAEIEVLAPARVTPQVGRNVG